MFATLEGLIGRFLYGCDTLCPFFPIIPFKSPKSSKIALFIEDFPGRRFQVEAVSGFGKKELKTFLQGLEKANITIRNFPSSVADLRKRLKLKEGGEDYIFATTLADESKILIRCKKVPSVLQELQSC